MVKFILNCAVLEFFKFKENALKKPHLFTKIDEIIARLEQQGVLNSILCPDEVDTLNQKMKEYIPNFESPLTNETGKEYCRTVIVTVVLETVFDKFGKDASDEEILKEVENYVIPINWVQVFEDLLADVEAVLNFLYLGPLVEAGLIKVLPDVERNKLYGLCDRTFPFVNPIKMVHQSQGKYRVWLSSLTLVSEWFDKKFKEQAEEYWSAQIEFHVQNPFFKVKKMQLDCNFAKVMAIKSIESLTWQKKEITFTTIEAELKEMYKKRPQYFMMVYVNLMRCGEEAVRPML